MVPKLTPAQRRIARVEARAHEAIRAAFDPAPAAAMVKASRALADAKGLKVPKKWTIDRVRAVVELQIARAHLSRAREAMFSFGARRQSPLWYDGGRADDQLAALLKAASKVPR